MAAQRLKAEDLDNFLDSFDCILLVRVISVSFRQMRAERGAAIGEQDCE